MARSKIPVDVIESWFREQIGAEVHLTPEEVRAFNFQYDAEHLDECSVDEFEDFLRDFHLSLYRPVK